MCASLEQTNHFLEDLAEIEGIGASIQEIVLVHRVFLDVGGAAHDTTSEVSMRKRHDSESNVREFENRATSLPSRNTSRVLPAGEMCARLSEIMGSLSEALAGENDVQRYRGLSEQSLTSVLLDYMRTTSIAALVHILLVALPTSEGLRLRTMLNDAFDMEESGASNFKAQAAQQAALGPLSGKVRVTSASLYRASPSAQSSGTVQACGDGPAPIDQLGNDFEEVMRSADVSPRAKLEWQKRYCKLKALLFSSQDHDRENFLMQLNEIYAEFQETAELYAQVLVQEVRLPHGDKSIVPIQDVGVQTREDPRKVYEAGGIMLQFVDECDDHTFGCGETSVKVACHNLKSLSLVSAAGVPGLEVPLTCLVAYRGYHVWAQACVFGLHRDKSLLQGSLDGGQSYTYAEPVVSQAVSYLAETLNLTGLCGDAEVHYSTDGWMYAIDMTRLIPPEPLRNEGDSEQQLLRDMFVRRLRPETLLSWKTKLCSDSFSEFDQSERRELHKEEVESCYQNMLTKSIPACAAELDGSICGGSDKEDALLSELLGEGSTLSLSACMHEHGVNVRHMKLLYDHVGNVARKQECMAEIAARSFKDLLLRGIKSSPTPLALVGDTVRVLCTPRSPKGKRIWEIISKVAAEKFRYGKREELQDMHNYMHWGHFLELLLRKCGLQYTIERHSSSAEDCLRRFNFDGICDILRENAFKCVGFTPRVKGMHLGACRHAMALLEKSARLDSMAPQSRSLCEEQVKLLNEALAGLHSHLSFPTGQVSYCASSVLVQLVIALGRLASHIPVEQSSSLIRVLKRMKLLLSRGLHMLQGYMRGKLSQIEYAASEDGSELSSVPRFEKSDVWKMVSEAGDTVISSSEWRLCCSNIFGACLQYQMVLNKCEYHVEDAFAAFRSLGHLRGIHSASPPSNLKALYEENTDDSSHKSCSSVEYSGTESVYTRRKLAVTAVSLMASAVMSVSSARSGIISVLSIIDRLSEAGDVHLAGKIASSVLCFATASGSHLLDESIKGFYSHLMMIIESSSESNTPTCPILLAERRMVSNVFNSRNLHVAVLPIWKFQAADVVKGTVLKADEFQNLINENAGRGFAFYGRIKIRLLQYFLWAEDMKSAEVITELVEDEFKALGSNLIALYLGEISEQECGRTFQRCCKGPDASVWVLIFTKFLRIISPLYDPGTFKKYCGTLLKLSKASIQGQLFAHDILVEHRICDLYSAYQSILRLEKNSSSKDYSDLLNVLWSILTQIQESIRVCRHGGYFRTSYIFQFLQLVAMEMLLDVVDSVLLLEGIDFSVETILEGDVAMSLSWCDRLLAMFEERQSECCPEEIPAVEVFARYAEKLNRVIALQEAMLDDVTVDIRDGNKRSDVQRIRFIRRTLIARDQIRVGPIFRYRIKAMCAGRTLKDVMKMFPSIPVEMVLEFASAMAEALARQYHGRNRMHNCIHPGTIEFSIDGQLHLKESCNSSIGSLTLPNMENLTHYSSPELLLRRLKPADSHIPIGYESDIYSIGACVFEMLTDLLPFDVATHPGDERVSVDEYAMRVHEKKGEIIGSLEEVAPGLPVSVTKIVNFMVGYSPQLRYQSLADMLGDLQHIFERKSGNIVTRHLRRSTPDWAALDSLRHEDVSRAAASLKKMCLTQERGDRNSLCRFLHFMCSDADDCAKTSAQMAELLGCQASDSQPSQTLSLEMKFSYGSIAPDCELAVAMRKVLDVASGNPNVLIELNQLETPSLLMGLQAVVVGHPIFKELKKVKTISASVVDMDAKVMACITVLIAMSKYYDIVITMHNVHFADPLAISFMFSLGRTVNSPFIVILTSRVLGAPQPGDIEASLLKLSLEVGSRHYLCVPLESVSIRAVRSAFERVFEPFEDSELAELVFRLVDVSRGAPQKIVLLLKSIYSQGMIYHDWLQGRFMIDQDVVPLLMSQEGRSRVLSYSYAEPPAGLENILILLHVLKGQVLASLLGVMAELTVVEFSDLAKQGLAHGYLSISLSNKLIELGPRGRDLEFDCIMNSRITSYNFKKALVSKLIILCRTEYASLFTSTGGEAYLCGTPGVIVSSINSKKPLTIDSVADMAIKNLRAASSSSDIPNLGEVHDQSMVACMPFVAETIAENMPDFYITSKMSIAFICLNYAKQLLESEQPSRGLQFFKISLCFAWLSNANRRARRAKSVANASEYPSLDKLSPEQFSLLLSSYDSGNRDVVLSFASDFVSALYHADGIASNGVIASEFLDLLSPHLSEYPRLVSRLHRAQANFLWNSERFGEAVLLHQDRLAGMKYDELTLAPNVSEECRAELLQAIASFIQTVKIDKKISTLPLVDGDYENRTRYCLTKILQAAMESEQFELALQVFTHLTKSMMNAGFTVLCPLALACGGSLIANIYGYQQEGGLLLEISECLIARIAHERRQWRVDMGRVCYYFATTCRWFQVPHKSRNIMKRGYGAAMTSGNRILPTHLAVQLVILDLTSSRDLGLLQSDLQNYVNAHLKEHQGSSARILALCLEATEVLRSNSKGHSLSLPQARSLMGSRPNDSLFVTAVGLANAIPKYIMGSFEGSSAILRECLRFCGERGRMFDSYYEVHLWCGLSVAAELDLANKGAAAIDDDTRAVLDDCLDICINQVSMWANVSPVNFAHKALILQGERLRIKGQFIQAHKVFEQASVACSAAEAVCLTMMVAERTADCMMGLDMVDSAVLYLQSAERLARSWGASSKASSLKSVWHSIMTR